MTRSRDCDGETTARLAAPQPMSRHAAVPVMNIGKTLQLTNPFGVFARNAPIGNADRPGKPNLY
jgi:hypothetical protein